MKSMKKLVLVGLVLLASVMVLVGCKMEVEPEGPQVKVPEGFVYIPKGSFQMGSNAGYDVNKPVHRVKISNGFFMGKYEVTQEEYSVIMGSNPSNFSSGAEEGENQELRPVENVSWYDAVVYCNKRSIAEKLEPVYKKEMKLILMNGETFLLRITPNGIT